MREKQVLARWDGKSINQIVRELEAEEQERHRLAIAKRLEREGDARQAEIRDCVEVLRGLSEEERIKTMDEATFLFARQ